MKTVEELAERIGYDFEQMEALKPGSGERLFIETLQRYGFIIDDLDPTKNVSNN